MPKTALVPELMLATTVSRTTLVLTETVKLLASHPDRVVVEVKTTADQLNLMVRVAKEDVGNVVGKQGRIAQSLRMLLHSIGQKSGIHINFDILGDN
jgi:predicted RNA-binding protein YlqC (UPF0109 family)